MTVPDVVRSLSARLEPLSEVGSSRDAPSRTTRQAGVLLLLYPGPMGVQFLLTERPLTLSHHGGQISLPGGSVEPFDGTLWQTALRETREELGVRTGRIHPLGRLSDVYVAASNYTIATFVGWNPTRPLMRPDPSEVAEVIEVPLSLLLDPSVIYEETWELRGGLWQVCFYRFDTKVVWGATARILCDCSERLRPAGTGAALRPGSVRPAV